MDDDLQRQATMEALITRMSIVMEDMLESMEVRDRANGNHTDAGTWNGLRSELSQLRVIWHYYRSKAAIR